MRKPDIGTLGFWAAIEWFVYERRHVLCRCDDRLSGLSVRLLNGFLARDAPGIAKMPAAV